MSETLALLDPTRIDPARWQSLASGRPHLRLELLQAWSAANPGLLRILAAGGDEALDAALIGIRVAAANERAVESLLFGRAHGALGSFANIGKYLCIGAPVGQDSGVLLTGQDEQSRERLHRLVAAAESWAEAQGLGLAFAAVPAAFTALSDVLCARGYLHSGGRANTELVVRWRDFAGYCAALEESSAYAGRNARYERRRCERNGVVISRIEPTAANCDRLQELAEAHYRHKNGTGLGLLAGFLGEVLPRLGDCVLLEARRGGECTAMLAFILSGDTAWAAFFGIGTDERPNDFTYFNLLFYTLPDHVAQLGVKRIVLGNSAYEAKLRRGATRVPMRFWASPRGRLRRALLRPVFAAHRRFVAAKLS